MTTKHDNADVATVLLTASASAPGLAIKKPRSQTGKDRRKEALWFANYERQLLNEVRLFYADQLGRTPSTTLVIRRALEVLRDRVLDTTHPEAEGIALIRARARM